MHLSGDVRSRYCFSRNIKIVQRACAIPISSMRRQSLHASYMIYSYLITREILMLSSQERKNFFCAKVIEAILIRIPGFDVDECPQSDGLDALRTYELCTVFLSRRA